MRSGIRAAPHGAARPERRIWEQSGFHCPGQLDDDGPFRAGSPSVLATLRLAGDDVADYLGIGSHFDLWLGSDVGRASSPAALSSDSSWRAPPPRLRARRVRAAARWMLHRPAIARLSPPPPLLVQAISAISAIDTTSHSSGHASRQRKPVRGRRRRRDPMSSSDIVGKRLAGEARPYFSRAGNASPAVSRVNMASRDASWGQSRRARPRSSPGPAAHVR